MLSVFALDVRLNGCEPLGMFRGCQPANFVGCIYKCIFL